MESESKKKKELKGLMKWSILLLSVLTFIGSTDLQKVSATEDSSRFIVDVAIGAFHGVAVAKDGTVWSWGNNSLGKLGLGKSVKQSKIPVKVMGIDNVIDIDAGINHTVALRKDGTVWVWGDNSKGQLGDGSFTSYTAENGGGARYIAEDRNAFQPQQVPNLTGIIGVSATYGGVIAWDRDGSLWSWGDSYMGLSYSGMNVEAEKKKLTPQKNEFINNAVSVTTKGQLLAVLSRDGTIWTQGYNEYGQLGDGKRSGPPATVHVPGLTNVVRLDTTGYTAVAFLNDGKVLEWGQALLESKGLNPTDPATRDKIPVHLQPTETQELQGLSAIQDTTAIFVKPSFLALKPDGTVWTHGDNESGQLGVSGVRERYNWAKVEGLSDITAIEGASAICAAIGKDGSVWTWGKNDYSQLGDGTNANRSIPASIGGFGSAAPKPETIPAAYQLSVNGKAVTLTVKPEIRGASVALQLGDAVTAFGAKVSWDKNKQTATITRGKHKVVLKLNSAQGVVNDKASNLPFAILKKGNDWVIPADWLVKQFGGTMKIDSTKQVISMILK
ncbi:stalk domain-containing protein [Cohnella silvisoli]|uniref:Stalk domain-containing protein n=1 Tax=Cohnella silvisoli TaxID=2873699 RepID=A0ABV1KSN3_9BACL|nr:stalk domain-containing protein [Cohnella silvisoli]MCD9024543.1 hypothetical protein [Cohnella silvisoli]